MIHPPRITRLLIVAICLVTAGIFLLDLYTPLGVVVWILYLLPILAAVGLTPARFQIPLGIIISLLVLFGLWKSSQGIPYELAGVNRPIALAMFWTVVAAGTACYWITIALIQSSTRAEEMLIESEETARTQFAELNLLYKSAPVGLAVLDRELRFLRLNDRLAAINGPTAAEQIGKRLREVLPDLADTLEPIYRRVFETGEPVLDIEIHGTTPAAPNTPLDWLASYFPLKNSDGATWGVSVVVMEITERKKMERDLADRENHLRSILDTEPACVKLLDRRGRLLEMNRAGLEMIEAEPADQVLGRNLLGLVDPEYRQAFESLTARVFKGETDSLEFGLVGLKGAHRWLETHAAPLHDSDGAITALLGITHDITKRKHAERDVAEANAALEAAQARGRVGSWELDLRTNTGTWSKQMYVLFERDPVLGPPTFDEFLELIHPDDRLPFQRQHASAHQTGESFSTDFRGNPARLGERYFHGAVDCLKHADGQAHRFAGTTIDISELRRADIALTQESQWNQRMLETMVDGFILANLAGTIMHVNPSYCATVGREAGELVGMNIRDLEAAQTPDEVTRRIEQFQKEERSVFSTRHRHKNGSEVNLQVSMTLVGHGPEAMAAAFVRDITNEKRAEQALRESEERLRMALDAAHMGIYDWDMQRDHITWSRWHEELWGYAPGEFDGSYQMFSRRVHPDDLLLVNADVARCVAARITLTREFRVIWPDGSVHWIAGQGEFKFGSNGQPLRMLGVVLEITERKLAEAALQEQGERLQLALNAARMGWWIWDIPTNQSTYSDEMGQFFGLLPGGGTASRDVLVAAIHPADRTRYDAIVARVLAEQDSYEAEYRVVWPDGSIHCLSSRGRLFRDTTGQPIRMIGVAMDVSERRLADEELRSSRERLARLTRELISAQETDRRNLARELHDEIGQVLSAVKMNLNTLKMKGPTTGPLDDSLAIVDHAIGQVRTLSLDLRPAMLDDLGLVPALRWYLDRQARRSGVTARLDADPQVEVLPGDIATVCFRIVQEAVTNVLRHARASHIQVELRQLDDWLVLSVQDDGVGFDVGAVRSRAMSGASLGLVGMEERAQLTGGTFEVHSNSGAGTEITVRIPIPASPP